VLVVGTGIVLLLLGPLARYTTSTTPWGYAEVAADGRHVTVHFIGGDPGHRDSPCYVDYSIHALEHADTVLSKVRGREKNVTKACDLVGYRHSLTATLHAPLAGRQVVDAFHHRINAVRDAEGRCIQPPVPWDQAPTPSNASTTVTVTTRPRSDPCDPD
jgi:hypothetical protein